MSETDRNEKVTDRNDILMDRIEKVTDGTTKQMDKTHYEGFILVQDKYGGILQKMTVEEPTYDDSIYPLSKMYDM
ncbi:hypothetical protein FOH38_05225 [Lysinibacillus fusiformis]|nr:hypothetical protein FOH38_05225 [Lysinibacillus fusiformis]